MSRDDDLPILPRPTYWNPAPGSFAICPGVRLWVDTDEMVQVCTDPVGVRQSVDEVLETFAGELTALGFEPAAGPWTPPMAGDAVWGPEIEFAVVADSSLGAEGYTVRTTPDSVAVTAQTPAGLFYATRSLLQLLAPAGRIPAGTIVDVPDIAIRFVLLDAGRKYWQLDYLKDLLRQMAAVKLNTLHLHLAEAEGFRLCSDRYPGLAEPAVSYNESQIRDLVEFARRLHIDVVPGFEFPGHATVVSEYFGIGMGQGTHPAGPEHMHSHLSPNWSLDFTSQAGRRISRELLETFVPWFSSPYVHLGGDELPNQLGDCERMRSFVAGTPGVENMGDALVCYLNELDSVVRGLARSAIVYNGVEHMSPARSLNLDIIVMDWEGEGTDPFFSGHQILTSNVDYAYVSPNNYGHNISHVDYIAQEWGIRAGDRHGGGLSVWSDYNMWASDEFFEQRLALPRAVMADRLWNTAKPAGGLDAIVGRARRLPSPPGCRGFSPIERVGSQRPRHHYYFGDSAYPPGFHWAGAPGNTLMLADSTGRLHGSSYILWNPVIVPDETFGSVWRFENNNSGVGFGGVDIPPPWTFVAWLKVSEWIDDAVLMSSFGGQIRFVRGAVVLADSAGNRSRLDTGEITVGQWVQVAVVASPELTRLYIDGVCTACVPAAIDLPIMSIGGQRDTPMFRGEMGELTIYDAALSEERVGNVDPNHRVRRSGT